MIDRVIGNIAHKIRNKANYTTQHILPNAASKLSQTELYQTLIRREQAKRDLKVPAPNLNQEQNKILEQIKENGYAIKNLSEIVGENASENFLNSIEEISSAESELAKRANEAESGVFVGNLQWLLKTHPDKAKEFFQFGLRPEFMNLAAGYLGTNSLAYHPVLIKLSVLISNKTKMDPNEAAHRDIEAKKMFRVFVYVSDTKQENGPFMILQKNNKWKSLTGKRGDILFVDTSWIHKAGELNSASRLACFWLYTHSIPDFPWMCNSNPITFLQLIFWQIFRTGPLHGLTSEAIDAACFRKNLPLPLKLIPIKGKGFLIW